MYKMKNLGPEWARRQEMPVDGTTLNNNYVDITQP
jgi:hypothetical protein